MKNIQLKTSDFQIFTPKFYGFVLISILLEIFGLILMITGGAR